MLPKHNAEGPARAAAEVQVDQARQGGRDVGAVVSERVREGLPNEIYPIGSSLRPGQLGISAREGILMSAYTKKYTKGDTIKKFFA